MSLSLTGEYANAPPHWGYSGAVDIPLDQGGRRQSRLTAADLGAVQAFYDYGEAVWAARVAIARARAQLFLLDDELTLARRAVALRQSRFDQLTQRVEAGEDARVTALLARNELTLAERRLVDLTAQRQQGLIALAKGIGLEPRALSSVTLEQADAAFDATALPTWRSDAAASRRDVLRAAADYDLAEEALRLEVAKQYPEVRLGPGYNYDHGVTKLPFNISLVLPPNDLNRHAIAQAEAKRAEAARVLETVQANALNAVDQAEAARSQAENQSRRAQDQDVPAARRMATAANVSRRAGETDATDQAAAAAAAVEADIAAIDAERAVRTATVDLEDALRHAFDPRETAVIETALKIAGDKR
jgi:CRISPR system Cascade subunit CasA